MRSLTKTLCVLFAVLLFTAICTVDVFAGEKTIVNNKKFKIIEWRYVENPAECWDFEAWSRVGKNNIYTFHFAPGYFDTSYEKISKKTGKRISFTKAEEKKYLKRGKKWINKQTKKVNKFTYKVYNYNVKKKAKGSLVKKHTRKDKRKYLIIKRKGYFHIEDKRYWADSYHEKNYTFHNLKGRKTYFVAFSSNLPIHGKRSAKVYVHGK